MYNFNQLFAHDSSVQGAYNKAQESVSVLRSMVPNHASIVDVPYVTREGSHKTIVSDSTFNAQKSLCLEYVKSCNALCEEAAVGIAMTTDSPIHAILKESSFPVISFAVGLKTQEGTQYISVEFKTGERLFNIPAVSKIFVENSVADKNGRKPCVTYSNDYHKRVEEARACFIGAQASTYAQDKTAFKKDFLANFEYNGGKDMFEKGADPFSKTTLTRVLQDAVDSIIFEPSESDATKNRFVVLKQHVNVIMGTLSSMSKTEVCHIGTANKGMFMDMITQLCFSLVRGESFTVNYTTNEKK